MIEIKPIVTEQDYENALKAVEPYFDARERGHGPARPAKK